MSAIVDPHIGFLSFQKALRKGIINPVFCEGHPELYVMHDEPEGGEPRLTYAFISGKVAKAYAVYIMAEALEGKPCLCLGYATDELYRNQGLATEIVKVSMEELRKAIAPQLREPGFYVEAIIGLDNLASQKVAARTLGGDPTRVIDAASGLPALRYVKFID